MNRFWSYLTVCSAILASGIPMIANGQSTDPAWLDNLNFQMERDENCEVAYYIRMSEGILGDEKTYEARLQCVDGRQFDASRVGEFNEFTLKRCEIEAC